VECQIRSVIGTSTSTRTRVLEDSLSEDKGQRTLVLEIKEDKKYKYTKRTSTKRTLVFQKSGYKDKKGHVYFCTLPITGLDSQARGRIKIHGCLEV